MTFIFVFLFNKIRNKKIITVFVNFGAKLIPQKN